MKCYYHPDRDAVASCKKCGRAICKECFDEDIVGRRFQLYDGLCPACRDRSHYVEHSRLKSEKCSDLEQHKKVFIRCIIIGLILAVAFFLAFMIIGMSNGHKFVAQLRNFGYAGAFGLLQLFTAPFGWWLISAIKSRISPDSNVTIKVYSLLMQFLRLILFLFKIFISTCIGLPAFVYFLIKWLVLKKRLNAISTD